ncbi:hypothetical protein JW905_07370 [bacterium]|nr:hypothetical protein [candidate division CSSED10-310 bacterium]
MRRTGPLMGLLIVAAIVVYLQTTGPDSGDDTYLETVVIDAPHQASLMKLQADLRTMRGAIEMFMAMRNRYPADLDELEREGILAKLPREAMGGHWEYNAETGEIKSSTYPDY